MLTYSTGLEVYILVCVSPNMQKSQYNACTRNVKFMHLLTGQIVFPKHYGM